MAGNQIIFIGGAPTAGKSTIARELSKYLGIPWISTDQIRDVMKLVARRVDHPDLFTPEGYDAERFLTEFSAEQIAAMEREGADAVWPGIKSLIDDGSWAEGCIIEGVDIAPSLIARDFKDNPHVKSVFLVDEDADRIRDIVFTRGVWDVANSYPDSVKEKEIEWVKIFSRKIQIEARQYGYPCIEVSKSDTDVAKVLMALKIS